MTDNVTNLHSIEGGADKPIPTDYTIQYQGPDGIMVTTVSGWLAYTNGMAMVLDEEGTIRFGTQVTLIVSVHGTPGEPAPTQLN